MRIKSKKIVNKSLDTYYIEVEDPHNYSVKTESSSIVIANTYASIKCMLTKY